MKWKPGIFVLMTYPLFMATRICLILFTMLAAMQGFSQVRIVCVNSDTLVLSHPFNKEVHHLLELQQETGGQRIDDCYHDSHYDLPDHLSPEAEQELLMEMRKALSRCDSLAHA
jgi:hypothetical protein